jgi:tetratricopeptide (TPR) repeat protein
LSAECHFSLGNSEAALRLLDEALAESPSTLDTLELKGRILLEEGEIEEAAHLFEEAVRDNPKDYIVRLQLAQTYRRLGRDEEAREHGTTGSRLRDMWNRFADLHEDAIDHPTDVEVRLQIGLLAVELNRGDLAKEWFRAVLHLDPSHQQARVEFEKLGARQ